jgi:hypothetical protein
MKYTYSPAGIKRELMRSGVNFKPEEVNSGLLKEDVFNSIL